MFPLKVWGDLTDGFAVRSAFTPAAFVGLGLIALWIYTRFPSRRPRGLMRAAGHVIVSFAVLMLLPVGLHLALSVGTGPEVGLAFLFGVAMPILCYVFLSWVWFLGCVVDRAGTPRGGHPVTDGAR
jgi:hypothetical protein